jgi:spore coat protein U-like protein
MHKYLLPVLAAAALFSATNANAYTATGNFTARITLLSSCTVGATDLDFGTTAQITGVQTATSTVSVTCSNNRPFALSLNAVTEEMVGVTVNTEVVAYTTAWAGGVSTGTGTGASQNFTINGTLDAQATPSDQDYTQARVVTVTY